MQEAEGAAITIISTPLALPAAILLAIVANELFFHFLRRVGNRSGQGGSGAAAMLRRLWWPSRVTVAALACQLALPFAHLNAAAYDLVQHLISLLLIGGAAWLLVAITFVAEDVSFWRFRIDTDDNLRARRVRTRVNVVRRITVVVVIMLALGAMLTTFSDVRSLGTSLLASAGIVGLVLGLAAQPIISNLLAGLQIFFADPLRIDDIVVVEHEWGRVEEITLTHIVLRRWDERALVLPLRYLLERPFQNLTRPTAKMLAEVTLTVDFTIPVTRVREELRRILEASSLWDRRIWMLRVTNVGREAVELRALMSARDAAAAWDLRCEVSEGLLLFLQGIVPSELPKRWASLAQSAIRSHGPNH